MKKLLSGSRLLVAGVALALVGAVLLAVLYPGLLPFILAGLAVVGLVWLGTHFATRWLRRRRQRGFDAGVAAKEGIEDRRREWASWTAELEKQGIDRYELPFYLLVGEPQSGKSVLLQNSDLHFPFGQTRLSGIGGTRGCDWWFTEEAVILDLAGRLFTHEGGASDAQEWEAFLELLSGFRPLCPANGVMLVIPCDSLLLDSRDEAVRKASRMQEALLTLTTKLQAQLPIYVTLTKGDKVFGFAETVHRLDTEKRHQMFGWSRRAEDFEEPFDMVEVRQAFGDMVERTRLLRETMLSSLRLPEGVSEADRVYAFPDELEALFPNLEVYLKRIFSESTLVDRLYFRGFYLTSGLQVGAPIARVCSNLLGAEGEADKRDLEGLFSKQQAYFIKDLIRRRVFSERGLVRPTEGRVTRAQRNAWIGYGAAGLIALASVAWSVVYATGRYEQAEVDTFRGAIRVGARIANRPTVELPDVAAALDSAWRARAVEPRDLEKPGVSRRGSFEKLYATLCDERYVPLLRDRMERDLAGALAEGAARPADAEEFLWRVEQARLLLEGFDPVQEARRARDGGERRPAGVLGALSDAGLRERAQALLLQLGELDHEPASSLAERKEGLPVGALGTAGSWLVDHWDDLLTSGAPLQVAGQAGYVVAWKAVLGTRDVLAAFDPGAAGDLATFEQEVRAFHAGAGRIRTPDPTRDDLVRKGDENALSRKRLEEQLAELEAARRALLATAQDLPSDSITVWTRLEELRRFVAREVFPQGEGLLADAAELLDARCVVPPVGLVGALDPALIEVSSPELLPWDASRPGGLAAKLAVAAGRFPSGTDGSPRRVLLGRALVLQGDYLERYPDVGALAAALGAPAGGRERLAATLDHLVELHVALTDLERDAQSAGERLLERWRNHLDLLVGEALGQTRPEELEQGTSLDARLLGALREARALGLGSPQQAAALISAHLLGVASANLEAWRPHPVDDEGTKLLLIDLGKFLATLEPVADPGQDGRLSAPAELLGWFGEVEELVDRHLQAHLGALERASAPPSATDLPAALQEVGMRIEPGTLKDWQAGLRAVQNLLDPVGLRPGLIEALARWDSLGSVREELPLIDARMRRGTAPHMTDRARRLSELVEALRVPGVIADGPRLAQALEEGLAGLREAGARPVASADEYYLERLAEYLEQRAVAALRTHYKQALEAHIERRDSLRRALYPVAEPEDETAARDALEGLADLAQEVRRELGELLDPGQAFDELQAAYLQTGSAPLSLRPAVRDLPLVPDDEAPWWALDTFLRELRTFLQDGDAELEMAAAEVKITLSRPADGDGVWSLPFLFTSLDEDNLLTTRVRFELPPWILGPSGKREFVLRWSRSALGDQPDDRWLEIGSCLGPLLLCWEYGRPEGARPSKEWRIDAPARGQRARLTIEFDRPLPVRPPRPW